MEEENKQKERMSFIRRKKKRKKYGISEKRKRIWKITVR